MHSDNPSSWARAQRAIQPPVPRVFATAHPAYVKPETRARREAEYNAEATARFLANGGRVPPKRVVAEYLSIAQHDVQRLGREATQLFRRRRRAWRGVWVPARRVYLGGADRLVRRLFAWLREVSA